MIRSIDEIPDEIERLSAAGFVTGREWTLAQITEHVARTMEWTMGRYAPNGRVARQGSSAIQFIARRLTLWTGWIPNNLPTFSELSPPPDADLNRAMDRLGRTIRDLHAWDQPMPVHPFLGKMSKRQWYRFHVVHARHHLKNLRRLV